MWNEQKQSRFAALRQRESEQSLTASEQAELTALIQEIEAAEAVYLRPATANLQREREQLEAQNEALQALAQRKQALVARLRVTLNEASQERRSIEAELAQVLGHRLTVEVGRSG